jgi:hypothetical protein
MNITRKQLMDEIDRRTPDERPTGWPWGNVHKYDRAVRLLQRLERGDKPTTREVVGYFGAGARFVEE